MTLQDRLDSANRQSVSLYLQRTQLEQQRQQVVMQAAMTDQHLLRLDGEIAILETLIAEAQRG